MHRRHSASAVTAAPLAGFALLLAAVEPLHARQHAVAAETHHYIRHYQATAYISLLSVSIFSRSGVGFGYAKADETIYSGRREISLQFLSGSYPERAHGLNRFGFIQENLTERDNVSTEGSYFGLMTASPEESFSQARAALETNSQTMPFVAAEAFVDRQMARYSIRHLTLPLSYRGANAEQLLKEVHASFERPETGQSEHRQVFNGEVMGMFLYSLREMMQANSDKLQKRFIYNGKTFRMVTEKHTDEKVGLELRTAGLIQQAAFVTRLTGAIQNENTREVTNFRLWFDRSSPDFLPLRFEFRPKSYLRLVFQATK